MRWNKPTNKLILVDEIHPNFEYDDDAYPFIIVDRRIKDELRIEEHILTFVNTAIGSNLHEDDNTTFTLAVKRFAKLCRDNPFIGKHQDFSTLKHPILNFYIRHIGSFSEGDEFIRICIEIFFLKGDLPEP
jgi:hypothetical protein